MCVCDCGEVIKASPPTPQPTRRRDRQYCSRKCNRLHVRAVVGARGQQDDPIGWEGLGIYGDDVTSADVLPARIAIACVRTYVRAFIHA